MTTMKELDQTGCSYGQKTRLGVRVGVIVLSVVALGSGAGWLAFDHLRHSTTDSTVRELKTGCKETRVLARENREEIVGLKSEQQMTNRLLKKQGEVLEEIHILAKRRTERGEPIR